MSQVINAVNNLIKALGLSGSVTPSTAQLAEVTSTITGLVVVGAPSPNGAVAVTVYPSTSAPVLLTFDNWPSPSPITAGDDTPHTLTYHSAAAQREIGVVDANDLFISFV